jgi:hypothetical protein
LTLCSYLYATLLFRRARPWLRALQCCAAGYGTVWLILLALSRVLFPVRIFVSGAGWFAAGVGVIVLALIFAILWQSFHRQWAPEAEELANRFD